jgi:hypothetical protein
MKKIFLLLLLSLGLAVGGSFGAGPAAARSPKVMRWQGCRVRLGDSVADLVSQFGRPSLRLELGELDDGWRHCRVELWVYDLYPWRYELRIVHGRIASLTKLRLKKTGSRPRRRP